MDLNSDCLSKEERINLYIYILLYFRVSRIPSTGSCISTNLLTLHSDTPRFGTVNLILWICSQSKDGEEQKTDLS